MLRTPVCVSALHWIGWGQRHLADRTEEDRASRPARRPNARVRGRLMAGEDSFERNLTPVSITSRKPHRATILLIEDDPSIADLLKETLEGSGYRAWVATDGAQAKAHMAEARPDLVLLDLMLPDVDGLVLCADLKAQSDVPIIICS